MGIALVYLGDAEICRLNLVAGTAGSEWRNRRPSERYSTPGVISEAILHSK